MKKILLSVALLCCYLLNATASGKTGVLQMKSPAGYQVLSISANGQWACGVHYNEDTDVSTAFRWNLTTNKIELIGQGCQASSISNDGVVAGSYYSTEGSNAGKSFEHAGIYKDGQWESLELPNTKGCWAYAITPDGQYITGTDNNYKSYIWKDGKIDSRITITPPHNGEGNGYFITYSISPDGQKAGGWSYYHSDNRDPGYWDAADNQFHDLSPTTGGSPWKAVKKFSSDSNKALFWGGYRIDPKNPDKGYGIAAIYDIATSDTTYIYPTEDDPFNFDFFDMNGDASVVVGYQQDLEGTEHGFIWNNGTSQFIEPYLVNLGANFDDLDMYELDEGDHYIARAMCIDADAKTFAILYYDTSFEYHSLIVALDRNVDMTPPVNLTIAQQTGLNTVKLEWEEPLGDKETLQGYNIYRNGEKINSSLYTETTYYDENLEAGTYTYRITAQYEEGETEDFTEATVTIAGQTIQAPVNIASRQKGYNTALAMWDAPLSNLPALNYYKDAQYDLEGFGGGTISFESGTLFPVSQMNLYKGFSLVGVSFCPKTEQGSWIINIYTHENGALKLLKSYTVDQELTYGQINTFMLPKQLKLQENHDLLIGIQTNVTDGGYDVQGIYYDCVTVGYSDLIRQVGEDDFYSINQASQDGEDYPLAWATAALLASEGTSSDVDDIDHYTVYVDGTEVKTTTDNTYTDDTLDDGLHTISVDAVYTDGRISETVSSEIYLEANEESLKKIEPEIEVEGSNVKATWETPLDDDATTMAYCGYTPATRCPNATESVTSFAARVDFLSDDLRTYNDYQIESVDFYPLSESTFTVQLYEGSDLLEEIPVDEFKLDEWNTVKLEHPYTIKPNTIYRYLIFCDDCPADESPLAIDKMDQHDNAAYLMADGDSNWYTIDEETGLSGNWLMRMNITDTNAQPFDISGYEVYVDNEDMGAQTSETFSHEVTTQKKVHTLRVDATYSKYNKTVKGTDVSFQIASDGIKDVESEESGTNSEELFNLAGQRVSKRTHGLIISNGKKIIK